MGSDSKNGVRHQRALSPRLSMMMMMIQKVAFVASPKACADFRLISITPVLTRILERGIVRQILCPAIFTPPPTLAFSDEFAFHPTESTTAAHAIASFLSTNQYVIVIAINFLRPLTQFGIVLCMLAKLVNIDSTYNWLVNFLAAISCALAIMGRYQPWCRCQPASSKALRSVR